MEAQTKKVSLVKIIATALVCFTLISCSKGGSIRSSEENVILGNSSFNPGEAAPGVEQAPQSSNSLLEQSQSSNLASVSIFTTGAFDGGYIPGGNNGTGTGDSGNIAKPGAGGTTGTTSPTTTLPDSSSSSSSSGVVSTTPTTTLPVTPEVPDTSSSSGTASNSTGTTSDGTSAVQPGGTDSGNIPGGGTVSGTDDGSIPSLNTGSTGSSTTTDVAGGTGSSGSSSSSDTASNSTNGNSTSGSTATLPDSGSSSSSDSNSGTAPNSGTPANSGGTTSGSNDVGSTPSTGGTDQASNNSGSTPSSGGTDNSGSSSNPSSNTGGTSTPNQPQFTIICHIPPGNEANAHTIVIGESAVSAHLAHGDTTGACPISNVGNNNNNNNSNPTPSNPSVPVDTDQDQSCPCKIPSHPSHGSCHTNDRKLVVNLGRVCSIRRSRSTDLFFEEASNPILAIEAIVPKGRIIYGGTSQNPYGYGNSQGYQQWGVLSAESQTKERFLIASYALKGVSLHEKKYSRQQKFNIKELKGKLGSDWSKAAIVASVCEDANGDGSCFGAKKSEFLSVVPATFKANRIPKQIALDVWNGRGLAQSTSEGACDKQYSPIVLDLTGEGIKLSGPEEGVQFDLNADGNEIYTGWIKGANNAFLVRDLDRNGIIDDGSELFGSATRLKSGKRAPNGFEALKDLDSNLDGLLTREDKEWPSLNLWFDRNFDGYSQRNELERLERFQVQSLNLNYIELLEMDEFGNQTRERSTYIRKIDRKEQPLLFVDIWFRTLVDY